jgi:hypothetical protein
MAFWLPVRSSFVVNVGDCGEIFLALDLRGSFPSESLGADMSAGGSRGLFPLRSITKPLTVEEGPPVGTFEVTVLDDDRNRDLPFQIKCFWWIPGSG